MVSMKPSELCLVCYHLVDKNIFVPAKESGKIFKNSLKYLHTAVATNIPGDEEEIQLENSTQLPFCKKCFDSSLELTQLTEELNKLQKEIFDLSTSFTLSVLHRRTNSVYFSSPGKTKSMSADETSQQTIKLNVTGLPPQLFSIHPMESTSQQAGENQPYYNIGNHFLLENNEETNEDFMFNLECGDDQSNNINQFNGEELNDPLDPLGEITVRQPVKRQITKRCELKSFPFSPNKKQENTETGGVGLLQPIKVPKIELERVDDVEMKIIPQKISLQHWVEKKGTVRKAGVGFHSTNRSYQPKTGVSSLRWKNKSMIKSQSEMMRRCEFCSKIFRSVVLLNRHKRRVHSSTGQLHCRICKKSFNQASGLKAHEVVHTTERPFKCGICEKTFRFDSNRIRHQGLHTKPNGRYPCTFCNKCFGLNSDWNDHMQNVHNVHNVSKPKKGSSSENSNNEAVKNSKITVKKTARKCSFCEKSFTKRSALKIHEQSHTQPTKAKKEKATRIYKCSYCGKGFDKRNARTEHEHVHTQERTYKCLYCGKTFLYGSNRSRHQRLVHNHNHNVG